jgi:hypothetical protein
VREGSNGTMFHVSFMELLVSLSNPHCIIHSKERFVIAATCSLEIFVLQTMDKKFAPNWHCIMGGSLGFEVILNFKCFCAFCNYFLSIQLRF